MHRVSYIIHYRRTRCPNRDSIEDNGNIGISMNTRKTKENERDPMRSNEIQ